MAGIPIHNIAVSGLETIFSLSQELKKSFTFVINRDVADTELSYDPVTRSYPIAATKETQLIVADVRYLRFKPQEVINSNGTLTPNSRKVIFRYLSLDGTAINETDQGLLPDGSQVEIKSIKYVPEVDPVFVSMVIEGVNDAISINT
jgi:hypothetical protein